jgi:Pyruvate/2-oxoacid:ferredoxin oxidoreductase gamma subunit
MEREIILTGIGGQGVQLGAEVLARAATLEGRHVMYLGTYGGTMRGGSTNSTLVVADHEISTPPIVSKAAAALAMHHRYWPPVAEKLRPGAVVVVNSTIFEGDLGTEHAQLYSVPASELASELGNSLSAMMVLVGAYCALTGTAGLDALTAAMSESIPPYRCQLIELNERALRSGWGALPRAAAPHFEAAGASV